MAQFKLIITQRIHGKWMKMVYLPTIFVHFYGINVGENTILHGSVMGKGNQFFFWTRSGGSSHGGQVMLPRCSKYT